MTNLWDCQTSTPSIKPTPKEEVINSKRRIKDLRSKLHGQYENLEEHLTDYFRDKLRQELIKAKNKRGIDKATQTSPCPNTHSRFFSFFRSS